METTLWTLGFQAVNVLVLVWLLARFLFRPVATMVTARQAEATRLLDEARAQRDAAAAERQELEQEAARAAQARIERLTVVTAEVEKQRTAMLAVAEAEAARLRSEAQADIARALKATADEAGRRAGRLAVDIAAKLLDRLPSEMRIGPFVAGLAAAVAALPEATRAELGAGGASVPLTAARPLTEAEAALCATALGAALGRQVRVDPRTDPALIAGLEIEAPHAVIRNSFRADLDRIGAEIGGGDG